MSQSQEGPGSTGLQRAGRGAAAVAVLGAVVGVVQQALLEGVQPWVIPVVVVLALVSAGTTAVALRIRSRAEHTALTRPDLSAARHATATIWSESGRIAGYGFLVADRCVLTLPEVVNAALDRAPEETSEPDGWLRCTWEADPDCRLEARVRAWHPGAFDLPDTVAPTRAGFAVLVLDDDETLPGHVLPVALKSPEESVRVEVEAWGEDAPLQASGAAHRRTSDLWTVVRGTGAGAPELGGAPVLRTYDMNVVGMVNGRVDADGSGGAVSFVPVKRPAIQDAVDALAAVGAGAVATAASAGPGPRRLLTAWWAPAAVAVLAAVLVVAVVRWPGAVGSPPACAGEEVPLNVVVGTEKDGLVRELAADFAERYRYQETRCADIDVSGVSSGVAADALEDAWISPPENQLAPGTTAPRPDVWMPTSSVWPRQLAATPGGIQLAGDWQADMTTVASSVLAVLMTEEKRDTLLGGGTVTWAELVERAADGQLTLALDDPVRSTSGMATSVALNQALADMGEDATVYRLRNAIASVPDELAGQEITKLMSALHDDPAALAQMDAVVAQEQTAVLFDCGSPLGVPPLDCDDVPANPAERLVAVQPADGTYAFDHPVVPLAPTDDDAARRAVAEAFATYLATDSHAQAEFRAWGFRPPGDPVTTTDELERIVDAAPAAGIDEWPDAATIRRYQEQWQSVRLPVRVHLTIDNSNSMTKAGSRAEVPGFQDPCTGAPTNHPDYLQLAKKATLDALERLDDGRDSVSVDAFPRPRGWTPTTMRTLDEDLRRDLRAAVCALDGNGGSTPLYDTIADAQRLMGEEASKPGPPSSTAVVVLSDGAQFPAGDLGALLDGIDGETAEPVISVAIGAEAPVDELVRIGDATGGAVRDLRSPEGVGDLDTVLVDVFSGLVGKQ
ncbi:VWA domain-containing protein [Myceligenerans salitolerans]|uniref:VWA domain-containing protein n=1 Tax=Myceligenerans salitolerans TaxID=1230528 RepID=A0ABS3IBE5_9MICO|nr:VWA domain-containing protein [Myceligenerans salitolerans]MBO0610305.1 VWA domain-containing protein [Myceligenerans salitolerans]